MRKDEVVIISKSEIKARAFDFDFQLRINIWWFGRY